MWWSWTKVHAITEREAQVFMEQHGVSRRSAEQLFGLDVLADVSTRSESARVSLSSADSNVFCSRKDLPECKPGENSGCCLMGRTAAAEGAQCHLWKIASERASRRPCGRCKGMHMQESSMDC